MSMVLELMGDRPTARTSLVTCDPEAIYHLLLSRLDDLAPAFPDEGLPCIVVGNRRWGFHEVAASGGLYTRETCEYRMMFWMLYSRDSLEPFRTMSLPEGREDVTRIGGPHFFLKILAGGVVIYIATDTEAFGRALIASILAVD